MHALITRVNRYAVHVLAECQAALSSIFAEPYLSGRQQFADVPHTIDADGVPIIGGTVAVLHCAAHAEVAAGDHSILVGQVLRTTDGPRTRPLIYQAGVYRRMGPRIAPCPASLA